MEDKHFRTSSAGKLVNAGMGVHSFMPNPLPPPIDYRPHLIALIAQAEADLGQLSGVGARLRNPHLLIYPYIRREAVLSSRIEGTQSTLSDLYLFEVEPEESPRQPDVREVGNYVWAMTGALEQLETLPLSLRMVRGMHATLMEGVRGDERTPGEFRRHQNYIAAPGTSIEDAIFIPPSVPQMHEALAAWEKFLHVRDVVSPLVQCALLHYQFEAIHPFADGNGRVGRLLIVLFLCERRRLGLPLLYLSAFFERHRKEYYDRLLAVSRDGNWVAWIEFFLRGVSSQSRAAVTHAGRILDLRETYRQRLQARRATGPTLAILDRLFENPYITVKRIVQQTGTTAPTAQKIVDRLVDAGILKEITGQKWGRVYCAVELRKTLEGPPVQD